MERTVMLVTVVVVGFGVVRPKQLHAEDIEAAGYLVSCEGVFLSARVLATTSRFWPGGRVVPVYVVWTVATVIVLT